MICLVNIEDRIPQSHPLRKMKPIADKVLKELSQSFGRMYSRTGRPSIPPERLLKGMLLIALYSIRSETELCQQLDYNMLFRWFLDMDLVEPSFDHCAFSDNRERMLKHDAAGKFFRGVVREAQSGGLMSEEHFSVDGTLIEAWASMKSFRPKNDNDSGDSNGWSDFQGKKRGNKTHESKTDKEARIFRKGRGKSAKLCFMGHALMENRNGLVANVKVTMATGHAEREAATEMIDESLRGKKATLGADAGYDAVDFVQQCRERNVTLHVARKKYSAIDGRTTRHAGYQISQTIRKTRYKGRAKVEFHAVITATAYNLLRISRLVVQPA